MKHHDQVAAFILAGGASSRMGRDKGLLEISGLPLIVRTAALIQPLVAKVAIVGAPEKYGTLGTETLPDGEFCAASPEERSPGPLAGIVTALAATSLPWNLLIACDLPYLTSEWLAWLLERAVASNAQAVVPRTVSGLEPLAALYRRECHAPLALTLARGIRKITHALQDLRVEIVHEREWRYIDHEERVLQNMNTPEDYAEAVRWHKERANFAHASVRRKPKPRAAPRRNK